MKKIFLICLLIIATQFVFAAMLWVSDKSNINKKTMDLGAIYNSDKGKDTVDLNFRDISTDKPNNPVNDNQLRDFCYNNLDYSTDNTNKDTVCLKARHFSTGNQNGEYVSTKEKNAKLERELISIILHTPGNTENNDSTFLKAKEVIKEKLHDLICWSPDDLGD